MNAKVNLRAGGFYLTAIGPEHTSQSLAQRMTGGGYVVCEDNRWGRKRTLIVNLKDVTSIELTEEPKEANDAQDR